MTTFDNRASEYCALFLSFRAHNSNLLESRLLSTSSSMYAKYLQFDYLQNLIGTHRGLLSI